RKNTLYGHPDGLRRECGFRTCGWREYPLAARSLLPDAMESDRPLPLIETALDGEKITPNYYEAAAFEALKGRVRSGDVAVSGSRRYRSFENYLLPSAHFEQLTEKQQTRLTVNADAEAYLAAKQQEIVERLTALQDSI